MAGIETFTCRAMNAPSDAVLDCPLYRLRFESLFHTGRAFTFPCDARGQVNLDDLSERARQSYLYARAVVGREFATPTVVRSDD